jgi:hypothetical protein
MASQLKVDTLTGVTTAGSIAVTGEGNSTTTNLQSGLAKAWAKVNQDTPAFRGSFNMSSLTDSSTGIYELNFTNIFSALDDYVINTNAQAEDHNTDKTEYQDYSASTTGKSNVRTIENNALRDQSISDNSLLGDLA